MTPHTKINSFLAMLAALVALALVLYSLLAPASPRDARWTNPALLGDD